MTVHRVRLYKSESGTVAVCATTHETAMAGHHLAALQQLNGRCGCRHRKQYNIWEEVRVAQNSHKFKTHPVKVVERQTITALNNRVYGR